MTLYSILLATFTSLLPTWAWGQTQRPDPRRFDDDIVKLTAGDTEELFSSKPIVFVGSSSIRLWDLPASFPQVTLVNRGFGGSHIADATYYADRIIIPYKPSLIVVYAGDNDIAHGLTPAEVFADYQAFVEKIWQALPAAKIVYIAIKPSLSRWHLYPQMRDANRLIAAAAAAEPRVTFVDIATPMLKDGKPGNQYFVADGLHLNSAGYELWSQRVGRVLEAATGANQSDKTDKRESKNKHVQ